MLDDIRLNEQDFLVLGYKPGESGVSFRKSTIVKEDLFYVQAWPSTGGMPGSWRVRVYAAEFPYLEGWELLDSNTIYNRDQLYELDQEVFET